MDFLYRLAVLDNVVSKLFFPQIEGVFGDNIIEHVTKSDFNEIVVDFHELGYECLSLLNKTDQKWLAAEMGSPKDHNCVTDVYPKILNNAITRHCWFQLAKENQWDVDLGLEPKTISEWLRNHLEENLGYSLEWKQRAQKEPEPIHHFHLKIAGVTFGNRQTVVRSCRPGEQLTLDTEPDNPVDPNAIRVLKNNMQQLGYIPADFAESITRQIVQGKLMCCWVSAVTGGGRKYSGCNILLCV